MRFSNRPERKKRRKLRPSEKRPFRTSGRIISPALKAVEERLEYRISPRHKSISA
jgi:hypothetical protein